MKVKQMNNYFKLEMSKSSCFAIGNLKLDIQTRSQAGIVSQLLLLLLLVGGVGLGTYLVQQRTNLAPKAAEVFHCASGSAEATNKIEGRQGSEICAAPGKPGLCGRQFLVYDHVEVDPNDPSSDKSKKYYCTWSACQTDSNGNYFDCSRPNEDKTAFPGGFLCTPDDQTEKYRRIGSSQQICNRNGDPNCQGIQVAEYVKNSENTGVSWCKWSECKPDPAKQCTPKAAQPATGAPEVPSKACAEKCPGNSLGCFEIDGKPRCVFSAKDSISCTPGEDTFCKNPPDPREGCQVAEAVLVKDQTKTSIKFTRCIAAKVGAAAATAAKTPNLALSSGAQSAPAANSQATGGGCGKNAEGVEIPCYAIGSFDEATLFNTKAGASIAAKNYQTYTEVISKISGYIGGLKTTVEKKNADGLAAAQMCVNQ